jgi:hypothetical protein
LLTKVKEDRKRDVREFRQSEMSGFLNAKNACKTGLSKVYGLLPE